MGVVIGVIVGLVAAILSICMVRRRHGLPPLNWSVQAWRVSSIVVGKPVCPTTGKEPVEAKPSFTVSREFQKAEAMAHMQQARVQTHERARRDSGGPLSPGELGGGEGDTHDESPVGAARQWLSGSVLRALEHDSEQFGMSGGEISTALTGERVGRARELAC